MGRCGVIARTGAGRQLSDVAGGVPDGGHEAKDEARLPNTLPDLAAPMNSDEPKLTNEVK